MVSRHALYVGWKFLIDCQHVLDSTNMIQTFLQVVFFVTTLRQGSTSSSLACPFSSQVWPIIAPIFCGTSFSSWDQLVDQGGRLKRKSLKNMIWKLACNLVCIIYDLRGMPESTPLYLLIMWQSLL